MPFRAAVWKENNWYVARAVELELATQAGSESEALENLQEAIGLHRDCQTSQIELQLDENPEHTHLEQQWRPDKPFRHVRLKLEALGFREITQRPNHAKFSKLEGQEKVSAILPHYTELTSYVVASICRQAGLPPDAFDA